MPKDWVSDTAQQLASLKATDHENKLLRLIICRLLWIHLGPNVEIPIPNVIADRDILIIELQGAYIQLRLKDDE